MVWPLFMNCRSTSWPGVISGHTHTIIITTTTTTTNANKNGKEVKNRLTGRGPLRRRRSVTDCTAIKKEVEEGEQKEEEKEVEEQEGEVEGNKGKRRRRRRSTHHTSVMQELTGARKIQRNSAHYLKESHEFLNMQHNFYTDKRARTYTPNAVTNILIRHKRYWHTS